MAGRVAGEKQKSRRGFRVAGHDPGLFFLALFFVCNVARRTGSAVDFWSMIGVVFLC
jgi:hypothetical protein